ncbi:MAG: NADH-quinone oxidoreductase subunit J [Syntrophobacteraceae bacterium]
MISLRIIFYVLATVIVAATAMAITRKNLVHAIVYLLQSFFATAVLFYMLGAPVLAALEVIIYAGAIMVLFLFIVMTLIGGETAAAHRRRQWIFPGILGVVSLAAAGFLIFEAPAMDTGLAPATVAPLVFGEYLFSKYWLPIEMVSFLLFVALAGALYLGRYKGAGDAEVAGDARSEVKP